MIDLLLKLLISVSDNVCVLFKANVALCLHVCSLSHAADNNPSSSFYCKFSAESVGRRVSHIAWYLAKIWTRAWWLGSVTIRTYLSI